ncbi:MAG: antitoxin Xre/MbcA/ParS toxin-binding domain-containing protein [Stenotrophobium sp.]
MLAALQYIVGTPHPNLSGLSDRVDSLANKGGAALELHDYLMQGLPCNVTAKFAAVFSVQPREVAAVIGRSERTLRGPGSKLLSVTEGDTLSRWLHIWVMAREVFEDGDYASTWLNQPCGALGGLRPLESLKSSSGEDIVLDELAKIEYGLPV